MKKLHRTALSFALTFTAVLALTSSARAQTGVGVAVTRGPHPAWEGKAAGAVQSFERKDGDLKTALLGQPVPDVWLEFTEGQQEWQTARKPSDTQGAVIKVALPPEARAVLKSFWEEALKFEYKEAFVKPRTAQERYDRDMAWTKYHRTRESKLQKIEIAAPDGRRAISYKEAVDLLVFTHKASINPIKSSKEQ